MTVVSATQVVVPVLRLGDEIGTLVAVLLIEQAIDIFIDGGRAIGVGGGHGIVAGAAIADGSVARGELGH